jgi:hypothetical protein
MLNSFELILDDESYITLSLANIGTEYYPINKFEPKCLVWVAMSAKSISEPFICPIGMGINQYVYLNNCIEARLVPFINEHHSKSNYVFWPDLASSHYTDTVLDYLIENSINHVEKINNPANLLECRPIEDF